MLNAKLFIFIIVFIVISGCGSEEPTKYLTLTNKFRNCTNLSFEVDYISVYINKRLVVEDEQLCGDFIAEVMVEDELVATQYHYSSYNNELKIENANTLWYNNSSLIRFNDKNEIAISYSSNDAVIRLDKFDFTENTIKDSVELNAFHKPDDHSSPSIIRDDDNVIMVSSHHSSELMLWVFNTIDENVSHQLIVDEGLTTYPQVHKLNDELIVIYREGYRGLEQYKGVVSLTYFNNEFNFNNIDSIITPASKADILFPYSKVIDDDLYVASTIYNSKSARHEGLVIHKIIKEDGGYKAIEIHHNSGIVNSRVHDIGYINGKLYLSLSDTSSEYSCCLDNASYLYEVNTQERVLMRDSFTAYYSQGAKISSHGLVYQPIIENEVFKIAIYSLNLNYELEYFNSIAVGDKFRELEIVDGLVKYIKFEEYDRYDDFDTDLILRF